MIRAASIADVPQLLKLARLMHGEAPNFAALPLSMARLEATFFRLIADDSALVAVLEWDAEVLGVMLAVSGLHWASDAVEVDELALYVHPRARGGVAAAHLIGRLKEFAEEQDAKIIRAGAAAGVDNDLVVRLYERAGFRVIGTDLQFIVKG